MQIITTIDDLGLHPAVRRAAEHLATRGRATSVSLLPNGPDAKNCFALEGVGLGVQANVLQGKPLSRQDRVSTMLRNDGRFFGNAQELFRRLLQGKVILSQIEQEWAAQIEFVLDHGVVPTHLACHGSMQGWPGLMHIAGRLAERYHIAWIRRPQRCEDVLSTGPGRSRAEFKNVCAMLRRLPDPIRMPDLVWGRGLEGDGHAMSFLRAMRTAGHDVVEIVGRPGLSVKGDEPLSKGFEAGPNRAHWGASLAAMESGQWRLVYEELDAVSTHYGLVTGSGT